MFVLGHRGMLGHMVARYLAERGYEVRTSDTRFVGVGRDALVEEVRDSEAPCVVNCLGRVPGPGLDPGELVRNNALLPLYLSQRLLPEQFLVHASSDGVFSGGRGAYRVDEAPDASDAYGVSKWLGEVVARRPRSVVVRCSIVGPDPVGGRGLLAWLLAHPADRPVSGYTNRFWNGITTLEWARLVEEMWLHHSAGGTSAPVVQPGTEVVDKYRLLCMIRDAFDTRHRVHPAEAETGIDLSLVPTLPRVPLREQLAEVAEWAGRA